MDVKNRFRCVLACMLSLLSMNAAKAKQALSFPEQTLETAALQAAIDSAAAKGGGVVEISPGEHLTGGLKLKSGVTLKLAKGAKLAGSRDLKDYESVGKRAFIFAEGATNIAIVGEGEINGNGDAFPCTISRPQLITLVDCKNVRIEGVRLRNGGSWCLQPQNCDGVVIRGIDLFNHVNHCNDGIDISSQNVLIENCKIDSDDDAIVFKTFNPNMRIENVTVRNCQIASCNNFIKFGTESHGVARNVDIHNCVMSAPTAAARWDWRGNTPGVKNYLVGLAGIAIESVDGGLVDGIKIRDIEMRNGPQTPIFIRLGRRHESRRGEPGDIRNVLIENVRSLTAESRIACSITGVKGLRPHGITLRNVELHQQAGGRVRDVVADIPENEKGYPENRMFAVMPLAAYGFFVRHADEIKFENVRLSYSGGREERPAVCYEDARVSCDGKCRFQQPDGDLPKVFERTPDIVRELKRKSWAKLQMGEAYFAPIEEGESKKSPLLVFCGRNKENPPDYAIGDAANRGWSLLLPFANNAEGVYAAVKGVKDRVDNARIYVKADDSALALELLAAHPGEFAAITVTNPQGLPTDLGLVRGAVIEMTVGIRDPKLADVLRAYNRLAEAKDRFTEADIRTIVATQAPLPGERYTKYDKGYNADAKRELICRRDSGGVRLNICDAVKVHNYTPSLWFLEDKTGCRAALAARGRQLLFAGDSTLCFRSCDDKSQSWGVAMATQALKDGIAVVNHAAGGKSTRTFREIWETKMLPAMGNGDRVIIQFGHNDMSKASNPKEPERRTDPNTEYKENLKRFIGEARAKGTEPLLITPITLYLYDKHGKLRENPLTRWVNAMKEVAAETNTEIVDLNAATHATMVAAGAEESKSWYMISIDGKDWAHPTEKGANKFAEVFLQRVKAEAPHFTEILK